MPLIERFRTQLPVRVGPEIAAWYPHTLAVAVSGAADEKWTPQKLVQVAEACASTFRDSFDTIEFFWGDFFDDWAIDLISREGANGLIGTSAGDQEILNGRYLARIVFPAALFRAAPNPRGNQSGTTHPVEGRVQEVLKSHVYLMHRFLVGFHAGEKRVTPTAVDRAIHDLRPMIKTVLHLTDVSQKAASTVERNDMDADRFIEMCIEQGPRFIGPLINDKTNKLSGEAMFKNGAIERTIQTEFKASGLFGQLLSEFEALSGAWERARLIRLGEQSARRAGKHNPLTVTQALDQPGFSAERIAQIAGESRKLPSLQVIADVARRHEFDLTTCHPTMQSLKPIAATMIAVSAFQRRAEVPSCETVDGVIAHHAVAAMATDKFAAEAKLNDFGHDWPCKMLKELATRLAKPMPRLQPIIPSGTGPLF